MKRHKAIVVQHCFGDVGNGGPIGAVQRLLNSDLKDKYQFHSCFQLYPANGINIPLIFDMARKIRARKPDLLHVRGLQNEGFHGLLAGRLSGCKKILVSVHGFVGDILYPASNIKQKIISKIIEPLTLRNADGVYCVSKYASSRPEITRNVRNNYGHIHNAVDHPALDYSVKTKMRNKMGIPEKEVVAITVSRMTKDKGIEILLKSLKILDRSICTPLTFIMVGDGPMMRHSEQMITQLNNIKLMTLGKRTDVPDLLMMSDLFVFPTLHENLSNSLIEAMSYSLPVVATDVGGNPEVVINCETGILIPAFKPKKLVDGIFTLINNKKMCKDLGMAGRSRIKKHFSMPVMLKNLDCVYRDMLAL